MNKSEDDFDDLIALLDEEDQLVSEVSVVELQLWPLWDSAFLVISFLAVCAPSPSVLQSAVMCRAGSAVIAESSCLHCRHG